MQVYHIIEVFFYNSIQTALRNAMDTFRGKKKRRWNCTKTLVSKPRLGKLITVIGKIYDDILKIKIKNLNLKKKQTLIKVQFWIFAYHWPLKSLLSHATLTSTSVYLASTYRDCLLKAWLIIEYVHVNKLERLFSFLLFFYFIFRRHRFRNTSIKSLISR